MNDLGRRLVAFLLSGGLAVLLYITPCDRSFSTSSIHPTRFCIGDCDTVLIPLFGRGVRNPRAVGCEYFLYKISSIVLIKLLLSIKPYDPVYEILKGVEDFCRNNILESFDLDTAVPSSTKLGGLS